MFTVSGREGVVHASPDFGEDGEWAFAGAGLIREGAEVTESIADEWLDAVDEAGADELSRLSGGEGLIILIEDFDNAVIRADVHGAVGALGGEDSQFSTAILVVGFAVKGVTDCVALMIEEGFGGGEGGLEGDGLAVVIDDEAGEGINAGGITFDVVGLEFFYFVDVRAKEVRGEMIAGHVELMPFFVEDPEGGCFSVGVGDDVSTDADGRVLFSFHTCESVTSYLEVCPGCGVEANISKE